MSVSQDVCTAPKEGCLIRRLSHDVGHHLIRRRKIDLNRVLQVQLTGKMRGLQGVQPWIQVTAEQLRPSDV